MTPVPPRADAKPFCPDKRPYFVGFDPAAVPSPCYVIDRAAVEWNLQMLRKVADHSGATMLLALKAFAPPPLFDLFRNYLDGACASGVYEARLAREEIASLPPAPAPPAARGGTVTPGGTATFQVHTYAPAYSDTDLDEILRLSDHVIFNSLYQWQQHRDRCRSSGNTSGPHTFGLRINPECSLGSVPIYDPCAIGSRLGITRAELDRQQQDCAYSSELTELHFHTLCENDSRALEQTLQAVERRFGDILRSPEITCLNLGGGHHITKPDYDRDHLVHMIRDLRERYQVKVILEPGEAAAIHTGILVSTVLDTPRNAMNLAILDTSATAHMPDTLEMPYRAAVWGSHEGPDRFLYRLGGQTCLAGDVIGDYGFDEPLRSGDRLVFDDMSHYTMVKTTTFNGIALPSIAIWDSRNGSLEIARRPEYADFRSRLG